MNTYVYKIEFYKSSYDLADDYDRLSDYEKEYISTLDAESFFDLNDGNDNYVVYVITSSLEIEQYLKILTNNLVKHKSTNLSNDILSNKVNLELELSNQISTLNSIKYSFFIDELNDWIFRNLEMDIILDRISEFGMSSLKEVEKEFLKNYNTKE